MGTVGAPEYDLRRGHVLGARTSIGTTIHEEIYSFEYSLRPEKNVNLVSREVKHF